MKGKSLLACVLACLSGCAYNLRGTPEENARLVERNKTVLETYFTSDAARELGEIRVSYAYLPGAPASAKGFSRMNLIQAAWTGHGYSAITVYNYDQKANISDKIIVHENTHHAEYRGIIDREEFALAWAQMRERQRGLPAFQRVCEMLDRKIKHFMGAMADDETVMLDERIAYMTEYVLKQPQLLTERMRSVYAPLLKDQKE